MEFWQKLMKSWELLLVQQTFPSCPPKLLLGKSQKFKLSEQECRYYKMQFLITLSYASAQLSCLRCQWLHTILTLPSPRRKKWKKYKKMVLSAAGTSILSPLLQFAEKCCSLGKSVTFCCLAEQRRHFSSEDVGDKFTLVFIFLVFCC